MSCLRTPYQSPLTGVTSDQYAKYLFPTNCAVTDWYFDLSQPPVGKRPVYGVRNQESQLPNILTKDYPSPIAGRDAGCLQPKWGPKCI